MANDTKAGHINEIDGLRALAVLAVLVFHYDKDWMPLGYLGVDIFFAISGFVITRSIQERLDSNTFSLNDFFMRRAKRLLPALITTITVSVVTFGLLFPQKDLLKAAAAAFVGLSNIYFWLNGQDYFGVDAELSPFTHTWSLGVEEQFYLFFPLLFLLTARSTRVRIATLTALMVISLCCYQYAWGEGSNMAFYLTPFRLWELGLGSLIYYLTTLKQRELSKIRFGAAVKVLMVAVLLFIMTFAVFAENLATILAVFASCLILMLSGATTGSTTLLSNRLSVFIGKISYSLYLWHWPVIVFLKIFGHANFTLAIYLAASFLLAILSYYFIEMPLRKDRLISSKRRFTVVFPAYVCLVGIILSGVSCFPTMKDLGDDSGFLDKSACHLPGKDGLDVCLNREEANRNIIWLFGDSHAGNYMVGLENAAMRLGAGFQYLTGRTLYYSLAGVCNEANCPEGGYEDYIDRLKNVAAPGDLVVMAFARSRFIDQDQALLDTFDRNLSTFIDTLEQLNLKVILVRDIPKPYRDEVEFSKSRHRQDDIVVSIEESLAGRASMDKVYANVASKTNAVCIDPHNLYCDQYRGGRRYCSGWFGARFIYLDSSPHLTSYASALSTDFFYSSLLPYLPR